MRKIRTILSVNSTFRKLEAQNQNVRSTTKTVFKVSKKIQKNFLKPGAFSGKQFCENCRACNFFAI